ncbi:MAG TPA: STAS domain-containing protein [Steroidobacteraceae bacterium]|nr:STAS domain-containing protein [Steroidobacteraceae bacterium]
MKAAKARTRTSARPKPKRRATPPPCVEPAPSPAPSAASPRRAGLKLETSCTLRDSMDMQFQLLAVDFGESDVLLDGSAVENIDTAGLQMLVSFAKHYAARGRRLQWLAASPELLRGSGLLGLDAVLGLEDLPAAGDRGGH